MSNPKLDISFAEASLADVEENNRKVRAGATSAQRSVMDEVQTEIDKVNANMDAQFEGDAKLRTWAKELLGYQISMTQIEDLRSKINSAKPGQVIVYHDVALIRTQFGIVDRAERYLFALEKTLIDLSNKAIPKQFSIEAKDKYTELSSFGLIKLAFKRLLKREHLS